MAVADISHMCSDTSSTILGFCGLLDPASAPLSASEGETQKMAETFVKMEKQLGFEMMGLPLGCRLYFLILISVEKKILQFQQFQGK